MGRLIYMLNTSVDGFVETADHGLDWGTTVDTEEMHAWFAARASRLAASLYGRRLYETMAAYWPTADTDPAVTKAGLEFQRQWLRIPKIVFSSTLPSVDWNSRLVRGDVGDELARLRGELDGDFEVGGATLAAEFIRRGLVDRYEVVTHPVILGSGTPYLPPLDRRIQLRLTDTHTFASGVTYRGYDAA
jgi:dihydrofolate reductase